MKENNKELMFIPLKTSFVKNNFIENYESNYEEYLTQFINNSRFVSDYGNEKFIHIKEQSKGEVDAENNFYQIDYKLLIDNKTMESLKYYSERISIDNNGARILIASEKDGTWRRYLLTNIMKNMSREDFEKLENQDSKELDELTLLVKHYLNKISRDKNILYFLPYNYFYQNTIMGEKEYLLLANKFTKDLNGFMEYRKGKTKKDTYLCFIVKRKVVFLKYVNNKFVLYDVVDENVSAKYEKLIDINDFWANSFW